jgi:hypothetical protein
MTEQMKSQKLKYDLDLLERIDPMEVSPSVWFRIQNRILALNADRFSVKMSWAMGVAAALFISLNIAVWFNHQPEAASENLAETFGLNTNNNLYE